MTTASTAGLAVHPLWRQLCTVGDADAQRALREDIEAHGKSQIARMLAA
jgi:hypothetical protein